MSATIWLLYVLCGVGNYQTIAMTTFTTVEQCQAARTAIVKATEDWWNGHIFSENAICIEVKP